MKYQKWICTLLAVCMLLTLLPSLSLRANAIETETIYACGFETEEEVDEWAFRDADEDGYNWEWKDSATEDGDFGHVDGTCALLSFSYKNGEGELTPDNWAYSPPIEIPALGEAWLSYYVFAQDPKYPAEHYSVYVYIPGEEMTLLLGETLEEGEDRLNPALRTLDLSAYAGKTIRIVFRHHDVTDEFAIGIDAVKVERTVPRDIGSVAVTVDEPVSGMPVTGTSSIPGDYSGYTIANVSWEPNDGEFQPGKAYSVIVTLEAESDHVFAGGISAWVNEHPASIVSQSPQELKISYTFPELLAPLPSMFFVDVQTKDWFYKDVEYVYYNRLMAGTGNNLFSPKVPTTRGMIVTVLYRMEGSPAVSGSCPFTDVKAGRYYEKPIIWAEENGIVKGVGEGRFDPDGKITREQLAAIFCRYAETKGFYDEEDCVMLAGFADYDKISGWARTSMSWAVGSGLISGSKEADGLYLLPKGNALRCQVAAILHRFCVNFGI